MQREHDYMAKSIKTYNDLDITVTDLIGYLIHLKIALKKRNPGD